MPSRIMRTEVTVTAPPREGAFRTVLRIVLSSKLNLLLVFLPVAIALELLHVHEGWIFATSALAVVPLAGLIGHATEELAHRTGPGIGGLLNATFGNGAELLIGAFAVQRGLHGVVKASLSGSIIGNILLVLGLAIVVGGWGRVKQRFSRVGAGAQTLMLYLAVVGMIMPAVYDLTVLGSLTATSAPLQTLSLLTAVVLLCAYFAGLVFSLRTHRDVFSATDDPSLSDATDEHPVSDATDEQGSARAASAPTLSTGASLALLAVSTALTAVAAEILVGSVEGTAHALGLTDLFIGMIVVAVVGNSAEHFTAVLVARRDNMQLAMNIAKESSVQIALFAAPALVFFSWAIGQPMDLVFHPFELFAVTLAVGAVTIVSLDGESHWYEGFLLLAVYVLVAIATFFVPS